MFLPQGLAAAHVPPVKAAFWDGQFASTQALAVKAYARTLRQETLLLGTCQGVCLPLLGLPLTRPEVWPCQQTLRNRWRVVPGGTLRPSFCFAQGEGELLALAAANRLVDFTAWGVLEDKCRLHELLMVGGQVGGRNLHVHGQILLWCCHTQRGRPGQPLKHHLHNMSCLMDAWRWQATLDRRRLRLCWPRSFAVPKQAAAAARAFLTSSGRLGLEADRKVWGTLLLFPVVARSGVTRLKKIPYSLTYSWVKDGIIPVHFGFVIPCTYPRKRNCADHFHLGVPCGFCPQGPHSKHMPKYRDCQTLPAADLGSGAMP